MGYRGDWQDDAACASMHPLIFVPDSDDPAVLAQALEVCARCPVARVCLFESMRHEGFGNHPRRFGVWGGTTPQQRAKITRAQLQAMREEVAA